MFLWMNAVAVAVVNLVFLLFEGGLRLQRAFS
jgi:hypothetical protein